MRHGASHPGRISARGSVFAAACDKPTKRGPSRCVPTPTSSRPHRCRQKRYWAQLRNAAATTSSPTTARSTRPAPGIRRHTTGSFVRIARTSSCICWPEAALRRARWQRAVGGRRRRAFRAPGRIGRMGKQRSRGKVLRGPKRPGLSRRARSIMSPPLDLINTSLKRSTVNADVVVIGGRIIGVFQRCTLHSGASPGLWSKRVSSAPNNRAEPGGCRQQNGTPANCRSPTRALSLGPFPQSGRRHRSPTLRPPPSH